MHLWWSWTQVLLAGRAAEEVFFGEDITSYGDHDIRDANDMVRISTSVCHVIRRAANPRSCSKLSSLI
jgi:ATP-dependent Zn protease